jgi:hypothetical protein
MDHLGDLRHPLVDARQGVGLVVDHDDDGELVERDHVRVKQFVCHWRASIAGAVRDGVR